MASEENIAAGVFELRADGNQFRAEIANTTEVAKRFERTVLESFNKAGAAASSTEKLESSSKRYVSAIEREAAAIERKTASLVLSATEIRKAEAAARGEAGAEAAIGKLDAAEKAYKRVSAAAQQAADVNAFGDMLTKSQALGQVEKNIDKLTAALDRLQGEARSVGTVRLSTARADETQKVKAADDNSFVEGLKRRSDAIGKTQADLLELQAAEKGLSTQAAPYIANLRAQEKALGIYSGGARDARVSTNQLRVAMQQLPAQFTDVFTSLAGGQNPLLVLIQQGGQIKDSFGGIGNALRALSSVLTPVRLAIGGIGAAVGILGLAYYQGSRRADEFRRAIVFSGNAAGATVGQLAVSVQTVSNAVGSQGKAAEVLAQLAASGKVAASEFDKLAEAAIRLEREGGPAVAKTIEAFASLRDAPTKGALKLNDTTNFLTVGVYKQIKALEEQGRVAEAGALAQSAYADASIQRSKTLEASLGTLERAWRTAKEAAVGAWSAFAGAVGSVGRPETTIERLAAAGEAFARSQEGRTQRRGTLNRSGIAGTGDFERQFQTANSAAGYEALNAYYETLSAKNVKATAEFDDLAKTVQTPGRALEILQDKLTALKAEGKIDPKDFAQAERRLIAASAAAAQSRAFRQAQLAGEGQLNADILDTTLKRITAESELLRLKGSSNPLARLNDEISAINAEAAAKEAASQKEESRLKRLIDLAKSENDNTGGIKSAEDAVKAELRKRAQIEVDRRAAEDLVRAKQAAPVRDLMRALREEGEAAIGAQAQQDSTATSATQKSIAEYAQGIRDSADAMRLEQSLSGESQRTRQIAIEQFNIKLELLRKIAEINSTQFAGDRQQATRLRDQAIADAQAAAAIAKASASSKANFDPPQLSAASAAVKDYLEDIERAGKATQDITRQTLNLLEDDLVQSLSRGKVDVKKTIDYMISEFLRLQVVRPLMKNLFGSGEGGASSLFSAFGDWSRGNTGAGGFFETGGGVGFAMGGAFSSSGPIPLAGGAVVNGATPFSAGGQRYVMAEAGPEAVMPLKRGSDGKLGVASSGSAPSIVNNMTVNGDVSPQTVALMNSLLSKNNAALIRGMKTGTIGVN